MSIPLAVVALVSAGVLYTLHFWAFPNVGFEASGLVTVGAMFVSAVAAGTAIVGGIAALKRRDKALPRVTLGIAVLALLALAYSCRLG